VPDARGVSWNRAWLLGLVLMIVTGGVYRFYQPTPVPLERRLDELPSVIGEWRGEAADPELEPFRLSTADEELFRVYRTADGAAVSLYVAYFARQEEGREIVTQPHLKLYGGRVVEVATGPDRTDRVRRIKLEEGPHERTVHVWYEVNGRVLAEPVAVKLATMADVVSSGHSNGALVLVGQPPARADRGDAAVERHASFIRQAAPLLRAALARR